MTTPSRPRTVRLTEAELEALIERGARKATADLEKRLQALEDAMKSGKGILIGAAAVLGFLLADGIAKIKHLMGVAT